MNLLENYLVEVFNIEPYESKWTKEDWAREKVWLKVTASFNCYGRITKTTDIYSKDEWDRIVERGYHLG